MKHPSLPVQMGIGLGFGVLVGLLVQYGNSAGWFAFDPKTLKPLGDLFISLIRMVVVPLVICTLISGAASTEDVRKMGRVAGKTLLYYFATTAVAIGIGLVLADLIQPGKGLALSLGGLSSKEVVPPTLTETLLNIVPRNPVDAMAKGNMLQIIFFSVLFGFALSAVGEKARPVRIFFDAASEVMLKLTHFVMLYAPIGVFALIAVTVGTHGAQILMPLIKVIACLYLAALLHVLLVYLPLVRFCGIKFRHFLRVLAEPLLVAFTTCSSAAALPATMAQTRELGASRSVSSLSIPLGNTINMDGSAIYMGVATIFVAGLYGMELSFTTQLTVMLIGILASVGTMGVPSGALVMISMVFVQIGIPLEGIALVAGIDRVLDMARTTLNILGDATGAVFVSKLEGELGKDQA